MPEPLDFSSGTTRTAPKPPAPRTTTTKKRPALVVGGLAVAALLAVVVVKVFGGDAETNAALPSRYCQLAGELDQAALATGAASAPGVYDGTPDKVKAAVDKMGNDLDQLRSAAPRAVRADVLAVADALETAAGGDATALRGPGFAATALRTSRFQATECAGGSGSGVGD